MDLTPMELNVLRVCAGEVFNLPYNEEQRRAEAHLVETGLIGRVLEDDQPTAYATQAGKEYLAALNAGKR